MMNYQYTPYLWLLAISFAILIVLAYYSYHYGKVKGTKAFSLCMLNFAFWVFSNGLEIAAIDLTTKLFWANMQYFSYTTIHIFWLYMVLQFTGHDDLIKAKRVILMLIIPALIILLVWTDQYHGLMRYGFTLDYTGDFVVIDKSYGPLYWIHPIYGYTIVMISVVLITRAVFIHKSIYRMQAIALLISPIISIVPSVLYVLSLSPIEGFDITPVFLGISGLVAAVGLFRYQLFAIVPVARNVAVDNMNIGTIVIDTMDNVVDANLIIGDLLGVEVKKLIGIKAEKALSFFGVKWSNLQNKKHMNHEVISKDSESKCYFEIQLLPVKSRYDKKVGRLILIRDVTEIKNTQAQLLEQSKELAISKERERLAKDLHDNLGQVLGFINLQAQGIKQELKKAGITKSAHNLSKLVDVTQSVHNDIRKYIHETRKSSIMEKNFTDFFISNIKQFEKQIGIDVVVKTPENTFIENLSKNQRVNIMYIVKETLNNIRKHAQTKNIYIYLNIEDKQMKIVIKDDGIGFDIDKLYLDGLGKYGLEIMEERALEIGATLQIHSVHKEGTEVCLKIPIEKGA